MPVSSDHILYFASELVSRNDNNTNITRQIRARFAKLLEALLTSKETDSYIDTSYRF